MKKAFLVVAIVLTGALILSSFALTYTLTPKGQAQLNADGYEYSDIAGIYLKIDDIRGESTDRDHRDWVEICSYNWSLENKFSDRSAGGGGAAGRVQANTFDFVKMYDKSSPKLFLYCCNGRHINDAVLEVTRFIQPDGIGQVFLKYEFRDVIIASYGTSGDMNRYPGVLDEFSINFARLQVTYTQYRADGTIVGQTTASWDFAVNRGS